MFPLNGDVLFSPFTGATNRQERSYGCSIVQPVDPFRLESKFRRAMTCDRHKPYPTEVYKDVGSHKLLLYGVAELFDVKH
jgi:hypothetical protein